MPLLLLHVLLGLTFAIPDGWQDVTALAKDRKLGLLDVDDKTEVRVAGARLDANGELEALMWTAVTQQEVPFDDDYLRQFSEQLMGRWRRLGDAQARPLDKGWVKLGARPAARLTIEHTVEGRRMRQLGYLVLVGDGTIGVLNYMCPAQEIGRYQPIFEASALAIATGSPPPVAPEVAGEPTPPPPSSVAAAAAPAASASASLRSTGDTFAASHADALEWIMYAAVAALLAASAVVWRLTRRAPSGH
jgi:hypothetical protein